MNDRGSFPDRVGDTGIPKARGDCACWMSAQDLFIFGGYGYGGKYVLFISLVYFHK